MLTSGHSVLITGGASGIGFALATEFKRRGNKVLICGRDEKKLREASERLGGCLTYTCDLANADSLKSLVRFVSEQFSDLSLLVNNAGVQHSYEFGTEFKCDALIEQEVMTNLISPLKMTNALLPLLLRRNESGVVNVTSALALSPKKSAPVYCATKAGLSNFSKGLRLQLKNTPVRVFEVIPPLVDTAMTSGRGKGKISPDEVAAAVLDGIASNIYEIRVGKTKLLFALNRISQNLVTNIMSNS